MKGRWTYWLMMAAVGALLVACASIGSPEGGPRDYTPPQVVKTSPEPGTVNFKGNKVEIVFDEIVNLKDQQKKVIISPAPRTMPLIRTVGKKVTVEFRDTLQDNTTYVIDFSNAIEDNNESNQLDGYTFAFSTGDQIDTLAVSGIVLRANDLEPMQHVIVGLHSNLDDTAFTNIPLERVSRTNDRGKFTIRNLKPGNYHLFALNDVDGDYHMARTEDIAFLDEVIVPSTSEYTSQDTVFTFDRRVDTVMTATHTLYLPNDLLLCMFNEGYKSHYIKQTSRPDANKLHVLFGAPNDTLPQLDIIRPAEVCNTLVTVISTVSPILFRPSSATIMVPSSMYPMAWPLSLPCLTSLMVIRSPGSTTGFRQLASLLMFRTSTPLMVATLFRL